MSELSIASEAPEAAAAFESAPREQPQSPDDRPDWLPEDFDTPEALAAAYRELKDGSTAPENIESSGEGEADGAVSKFVRDTGLDPVGLTREIAATGDIGPEAKKALAARLGKAGIPGAVIDEYIAGQRAAIDAGVRDIKAAAGGEKGWRAMAEWAGSALSDAELQAFNRIVTETDSAMAKFAVGNLYARYKAEGANPGRRVRGTTGGWGGDVYHSFEQLVEAQKNPRYASDPAFREGVERKIERTYKAGGFRIKTR